MPDVCLEKKAVSVGVRGCVVGVRAVEVGDVDCTLDVCLEKKVVSVGAGALVGSVWGVEVEVEGAGVLGGAVLGGLGWKKDWMSGLSRSWKLVAQTPRRIRGTGRFCIAS